MKLTPYVLLTLALAVGCHDSGLAPATPDQRVSHSDQATVQSLADEIQTASDPVSEANTLKRFRQYAADHGYTYRVNSFMPGTRLRIADATARRTPVVTEVQVYHADQLVHTFTFTPRDNHNIYLIAKG